MKISRHAAEPAALLVFLAVLFAIPWLVHVASLAILRVDPGATPETFAVIYRTVEDRYAASHWPCCYPSADASRFKSFRLPDSAGYIDGPKVQYSFTVLEDGETRQVVEVRTTGLVSAVSRYAAHSDRIVPLSYRGMLWGYQHATALPGVLVAFALALLAAWSAFAATARFARNRQMEQP